MVILEQEGHCQKYSFHKLYQGWSSPLLVCIYYLQKITLISSCKILPIYHNKIFARDANI